MTRFVVDASAVIHLAETGMTVADEHHLMAPTLLRSQVLSVLHEAVVRGDLPATVALERLQSTWAMPIRLLGDAVLRRRAWDLAERHGWTSTYEAEYVALCQLQQGTLVTLDPDLAHRADGIVAVAPVDALRQSG